MSKSLPPVVRITSKGQLTVPKRVREKLGVAPGDELEFVEVIKMRDGKMVQIGTAEDIVMHPADDYVADFVAGISRLKVVHAHVVMQPLDAYVSAQGALPADTPRVDKNETLSNLINLAIEEENAILVKDGVADIGVITRADLLRTVIEGTEVS